MQKISYDKLLIAALAAISAVVVSPQFVSAKNHIFSAVEDANLYTNIDADILSQLHHSD